MTAAAWPASLLVHCGGDRRDRVKRVIAHVGDGARKECRCLERTDGRTDARGQRNEPIFVFVAAADGQMDKYPE